MLSKQEVFDKVSKHLLTQNAKSVGSDGECRYRGDNGMMCAVGCLIPNAVYSAKMEYKSVTTLAQLDTLPHLHHHAELLQRLQHIHDREPVEDWAYYLKALAEQKGLSFEAS